MRSFLLVCFSLSLIGRITAQATITIPAFTAYAVPAEKEEHDLFDPSKGFLRLKDKKQQIDFYFYAKDTGKLSVSVMGRSIKTARVEVNVAGSANIKPIPAGKDFKNIGLGTCHITIPGFQKISFKALDMPAVIDIQSLQLSGDMVKTIHFNDKPRRNAASVHLKYLLDDTVKATQFYAELKVPKGADIVHSYYMSCGFSRGYFGIQVNSEKERRVIFSVWDAGKEAFDRNKVADSNKVQLLAKGENVFADGFGNEGTGGHSHWVYNWKADTVYKFLVTIIPDSATNTTIYTGYFFLPEEQKWKLIASFKAPADGKYLHNLYSFNEDFSSVNGQLQRKAYFGNQWIQRENGSWKELTEAKFSYDATGKAGDRIDYGGGVEDNRFYLWNGGFRPANTKLGDLYTRTPTRLRPVIDLNKNADSVIQFKKDIHEIKEAVAAKKIDTTGSVENVYYQLLKEGTGETVSVNDTVTVFYKGTLLKDGSIFDQTKDDKPATFPLKRLIRGWQIGLSKCKVGGKIRLYIPSALGYSIRSRSKAIPPNSVLVFDIEVLSVKH